MEPRPRFYVPACLGSFQGFSVRDIKEFRVDKRVEVHLEQLHENHRACWKCDGQLGSYHDNYKIRAKHLKMMGWQVEIVFFREKRFCHNCKKTRSQKIDWLCPTNPHVTMDLAWWLSRLTEVTTVLATSKLESLDKKSCYKIDKYILRRLLQGYTIPKIRSISVDEVYARGPRQLKEGENRDDLFLTIIVDLKTHKVIWVSQSRRKQALDEFFQILGEEACRDIEVVATDQHEDYAASIREYCPKATQVWDRFHLIQNFNEALNTDRHVELERLDPEGEMEDLMNNKYRHKFLTKKTNRSSKDQRHVDEVFRLNTKMATMEVIKEHLHKMFETQDVIEAKEMMNEIYEWSYQAKCWNINKWVWSVMEDQRLWNYFESRVTTGVSEGINRAIKGLKWQAYNYKDMEYFALKILQKVGYLNSFFHNSQYSIIWSSH